MRFVENIFQEEQDTVGGQVKLKNNVSSQASYYHRTLIEVISNSSFGDPTEAECEVRTSDRLPLKQNQIRFLPRLQNNLQKNYLSFQNFGDILRHIYLLRGGGGGGGGGGGHDLPDE